MDRQEIQDVIDELYETLAALHASFANRPYPLAVHRFIKTVKRELAEAQYMLDQFSGCDLGSIA